MGSEMCIRDSLHPLRADPARLHRGSERVRSDQPRHPEVLGRHPQARRSAEHLRDLSRHQGQTEGSARVHPARASDRAQLRGRPLLHHAPSSALGDRSQSPHRQIRRCRFRMGPLRSRRRPEDQQLQVDRVLRARRFRAARIQESLLFVPHPAERDRQEPRSGPEPRMVMVFNTTKQ